MNAELLKEQRYQISKETHIILVDTCMVHKEKKQMAIERSGKMKNYEHRRCRCHRHHKHQTNLLLSVSACMNSEVCLSTCPATSLGLSALPNELDLKR